MNQNKTNKNYLGQFLYYWTFAAAIVVPFLVAFGQSPSGETSGIMSLDTVVLYAPLFFAYHLVFAILTVIAYRKTRALPPFLSILLILYYASVFAAINGIAFTIAVYATIILGISTLTLLLALSIRK